MGRTPTLRYLVVGQRDRMGIRRSRGIQRDRVGIQRDRM